MESYGYLVIFALMTFLTILANTEKAKPQSNFKKFEKIAKKY